jgi:hypothetical protein
MRCESIGWVASQIGAMQPSRSNAFNPRPPGVIRPGSGTHMLLQLLERNPNRWFFHQELVLALGRSKGEVDWAVQYLKQRELIEWRETELPARRAVMRYRLVITLRQ